MPEARSRRGCLGVPLAIWLPGLYLAFAVYGWVDFARTNPDGLANLGLFLITAPVTVVMLIIGGLLGRQSFPMPSGHGYLGDHAFYYVPAVLVTAVILWFVGRAIDRAIGRARR
jgi:hypothetical protein